MRVLAMLKVCLLAAAVDQEARENAAYDKLRFMM